jgi:hypothetical protein
LPKDLAYRVHVFINLFLFLLKISISNNDFYFTYDIFFLKYEDFSRILY